jgi:hypothetical protein
MSVRDNETIEPQENLFLFHSIVEALTLGGSLGPLERTERRIQAMAKVFLFLGFATLDEENRMGHRPTRYLAEIIARRPKRRLKSKKELWDFEDLDFLESILEAALGEGWFDPDLRAFVFNVLGALGLIRYAKRGGEIPTAQLREIAAWRLCFERRRRYQ